MNQNQSEMTFRALPGKHASQAFDFYGFKPFYAFLNDFEFFYPFNFFYPLLGYFVTSLLFLVTPQIMKFHLAKSEFVTYYYLSFVLKLTG